MGAGESSLSCVWIPERELFMRIPTPTGFRRIVAVLSGAALICGFTGCASNFAEAGEKYSVVVERQHDPSGAPAASYPLSVGTAKYITNSGENRYVFINTTTVVGADCFVRFAPGSYKTRFTITPSDKHKGKTLMFVIREPHTSKVMGAGTVAVKGDDDTKGLGSPISVGRN